MLEGERAFSQNPKQTSWGVHISVVVIRAPGHRVLLLPGTGQYVLPFLLELGVNLKHALAGKM